MDVLDGAPPEVPARAMPTRRTIPTQAGERPRTVASLDLQNLRKRAKRLVRQHAARHVPVAERIRRALPDLAHRSDREVLEAALPLARAQQVVARELGFEDWTHLKRGAESMTANDRDGLRAAAPTEPTLLHANPQIFVTDMAHAVAFYRDRLGFSVEYLWGEPPFYGLVARDGVGLNLRHVKALPIDPQRRDAEDLLAVTLVVRGAKALFLACKEAGAPIHQPYREQPWGAHDFIVTDPDGNRIHFASRRGEL